MAAGLHQHALARIDEDAGKIGGRCTSHHIAGILFMARTIRDDEFALLGVEEAVGDVNGDALLTLGGEAVDQQREIDFLALRA